MSYKPFALKYRPQTFEEIVGQPHVSQTLQNAVAQGRIVHGYLFSGPRGTGKTSTARVFAKAINCAEGPTPRPCSASSDTGSGRRPSEQCGQGGTDRERRVRPFVGCER